MLYLLWGFQNLRKIHGKIDFSNYFHVYLDSHATPNKYYLDLPVTGYKKRQNFHHTFGGLMQPLPTSIQGKISG